MNTENRVSPQAPEIEEAIIGACLIEQRAIPLIADKLRPEMFYVLRHQLIYAAILAMYHAGMKIDILTVKEELSHRGKLEEAGGGGGGRTPPRHTAYDHNFHLALSTIAEISDLGR